MAHWPSSKVGQCSQEHDNHFRNVWICFIGFYYQASISLHHTVKQSTRNISQQLLLFLSVQRNTLHGTEYKIIGGVCLSVCAHGFWGRVSQKRLKIETRFQCDSNRKWHMANQSIHVTDDVMWPWKVKVMTPKCLWPIILKIKAGDTDSVTIEHLEEMTLRYQMVPWLVTLCYPKRSRSWPRYIWMQIHYLENGWRY